MLSAAVWDLPGRDKAMHVDVPRLSHQMKALREQRYLQRRDEHFFFPQINKKPKKTFHRGKNVSIFISGDYSVVAEQDFSLDCVK